MSTNTPMGMKRVSTAILFAIMALWSVCSSALAARYCTVEQVDPVTMWRVDTSSLPSCSAVIAKSRTFAKDLQYTRIEGRVYFVRKRAEASSIDLMEVPGPVAFDRLKSYLSGTYASDGNVLLYGPHRVETNNLSINPGSLRRLPTFGTEPSRYVTDGHLVLYEDQMLDGADAATFTTIVQPAGRGERATELARDRSSVYYGSERIPDADSASFRVVDFSRSIDADVRGYYFVDNAHVWHLFGGVRLVAPEFADKVRRRMLEPSASIPEPWTVPRPLKISASILLVVITCVLVHRLRRRIKSLYQTSLLSPAVVAVSTAYLIFPSIAYALLYSRCSEPSEVVVWCLTAGAIVGGACVIGAANCCFMRRVDAAATTFVQLGIVTIVLVIGTVPPGFVKGLSSIPAGISRQCPSD